VREFDSQVKLFMQNDGNFVVYDKGSNNPLWSIKKSGYNCHMIFQGDGNLVAYQGKTVIWASGSLGGQRLIYQNSRPYLRILDSRGSEIWSSGY
jgi:hypothetical protein